MKMLFFLQHQSSMFKKDWIYSILWVFQSAVVKILFEFLELRLLFSFHMLLQSRNWEQN